MSIVSFLPDISSFLRDQDSSGHTLYVPLLIHRILCSFFLIKMIKVSFPQVKKYLLVNLVTVFHSLLVKQ